MVGAFLVKLVYPFAQRRTRLALRASWCRRMLSVLGVQLHVSGNVPTGCYLIASNHVSWLDVFAIGAVFPCWFVSKAETRTWPFVGWMAEANETLFLRRASPRAVYRMNGEIRTRLRSSRSVVVFPEGTTTDGTRVLDFFPALFQPAVDTGLPVLPLALAYRDKAARTATAVAYINNDTIWPSLRAVLDAPCTEAHLILEDLLSAPGQKRRQLAAQACDSIRRLHLRVTGAPRHEEPRATAPLLPATSGVAELPERVGAPD
jgi:1-acyl-sn-glycerol-3-phosphate acyltransferase